MSQKLEKLNALKEKLKLGGEEDAISKQHSKGKLTARERLNKFFDAGTFVETGLFIEGVFTGFGQVNGRLVYAVAEDFTACDGALGKMHTKKIVKCQDAALKVGAPIVYMKDSGGARIEEGLEALAGYGKIIKNIAKASGVVPQISMIMGPSIGVSAMASELCDFVFMVDKNATMCVNGATVLQATNKNSVTSDQVGGALVNCKSGVATLHCPNEDECIAKARLLISYLPENNMEKSETINLTDDLNRVIPELNDLVPDDLSRPYDMKNVILKVVDNGVFFETQTDFAKNIITGFAHIGGKSVGIVANEPTEKNGAIDNDASDKASRFIRICDSYNIPVLTFEDSDGFVVDTKEEQAGLVRHGAKLFYSYIEASVPMITIIVGKAIGSSYICMGSKHLGVDIVYAWPQSEVAIINAEGAADVLHYNDIKNAKDQKQASSNYANEYKEKVMCPNVAAEKFYVDDVIEPAETRKYIIAAIDLLESKVVNKVNRKHGNIPL